MNYEDRVNLLPTSGFVSGRDELVQSGFDNVLDELRKHIADKPLKVAIIDTAISGTSTRKLNDELKREFSLRKERYGTVLYYIAKLWKTDADDQRVGFVNFHCNSDIPIHHGVAFVPDLLCEDRPDLLGIDYPYHADGQDRPRNDRKIPHASYVIAKKLIRVIGDEHTIEYPPLPTTADTFITLICKYASGSGNDLKFII